MNNSISLTAAVFSLLIYVGCDHLFPRYSVEQRGYEKVIETVRDTINDELSNIATSREIFDTNQFDIKRYKITNNLGVVEYDFNALARYLALEGHRDISSSNANSATAKLIKSGYIQGLQMTLEVIEETRRMNH